MPRRQALSMLTTGCVCSTPCSPCNAKCPVLKPHWHMIFKHVLFGCHRLFGKLFSTTTKKCMYFLMACFVFLMSSSNTGLSWLLWRWTLEKRVFSCLNASLMSVSHWCFYYECELCTLFWLSLLGPLLSHSCGICWHDYQKAAAMASYEFNLVLFQHLFKARSYRSCSFCKSAFLFQLFNLLHFTKLCLCFFLCYLVLSNWCLFINEVVSVFGVVTHSCWTLLFCLLQNPSLRDLWLCWCLVHDKNPLASGGAFVSHPAEYVGAEGIPVTDLCSKMAENKHC